MCTDCWAKNTTNSTKCICPICLPRSKSSGFQWKKASLGVRIPCLTRNQAIFNIIRWVAWSLGCWDKQLINQVSDVPSIFFALSLQFIYLFIYNKKLWVWYMKKNASDTWLMIRLPQRTSKPAYYIEDCQRWLVTSSINFKLLSHRYHHLRMTL